MPPIQQGPSSDIGRATLISGWLLATLTSIGLGLSIWAKLSAMVGVGLDDIFLVVATIISLALLIQTTWAIVDEGQGQHVEAESQSDIAIVAKVQFLQSLMSTKLTVT